MIKIINILHHNPNPIILNIKNPDLYLSQYGPMEYEEMDKYPYWIGFFINDHHVVFADKIKSIPGNIEFECWRPYFKIKKSYQKKIDEFLHRVFPSKTFSIPLIGKFLKSKSLLNALKKEIKKNKIIIHYHDGHSRFIRWLILKLKKENVPMIYQHRSSNFSMVKLNNASFLGKLKNVIWYIDSYYEKKSLQRLDYYYSGSKVEAAYIKNDLKYSDVEYFIEGVDFNLFKPAKNKEQIRRELNIPVSKIIIICIGKFEYPLNFKKTVKILKKIKSNIPDIELLAIGGYKKNEDYNFCIKEGVIVKERMNVDKLIKYYQAADINLYPIFNEEIINASGFGSANIEALACGLPMLSNNIKHFSGTNEETEKIGMTIKTEIELEKNLVFMIKNLDKFSTCREIAKKYYDIEISVNKYKIKYAELAKSYY